MKISVLKWVYDAPSHLFSYKVTLIENKWTRKLHFMFSYTGKERPVQSLKTSRDTSPSSSSAVASSKVCYILKINLKRNYKVNEMDRLVQMLLFFTVKPNEGNLLHLKTWILSSHNLKVAIKINEQFSWRLFLIGHAKISTYCSHCSSWP